VDNLQRFVLAMLVFSAPVSADYYQAAMNQAAWKFSGNKDGCSLTQDISVYGKAEFVSKPGQALRFSIQEQRRKPSIIKASLAVMPAPWIHQPVEDRNYQVYLDNAGDVKDYGRLSVYANDAEAMLDVLLQGQYPTFSYIRAASSLDVEETRVAVSSIKFGDKYKEFLACRNNLATVSMANNAVANGARKKRRG
jgi:sodium-type flagellar protein MotY